MDFSEEWKFLWRVAEVYSSPALADQYLPPPKRPRHEFPEEKEEGNCEDIGPVIFAPCPETLVRLISSPSLAPRLPQPYPRLSLHRFLKTSTSSLLYSDASTIASELGPQEGLDFSYSYLHGFNSLQLLTYKCGTSDESFYLAFFPTGENCDEVGFLKFCIKDSKMGFGSGCEYQRVLTTGDRLKSRILKLLVNPVSDYDDFSTVCSATSSSASSVAIIGYAMACTMYSVHWYTVKLRSDGFGGRSVKVEYLGRNFFRSFAVIHACWSPHLNEECAILLESGEVFLFDVGSHNEVKKRKLKILWGGTNLKDTGRGCWFAIEFSWHPRILIVGHVSAIFVIDARSNGCSVSCLLKIEMLSPKIDRFLTLCRAGGSDGFNFCVASRRFLVLCDVRQPFKPLLQWVHNLDNPCFITFFRLSELRMNAKNDKFKWATNLGSCIFLGSFWNSEFRLFTYGPKSSSKCFSSEIAKFCGSLYAWGLPSEFSLSGNDTHCADCLVRDEFSKEALPRWIDWRQKRGLVMGFSILDGDPWAQTPKADSFGGFLLIRLMSSGKLEAMRYQAVWEFDQNNDQPHLKPLCGSQADLLYDAVEAKDNYQKNTGYLMLEHLGGYLKGDLDEVLVEKMKKFNAIDLQRASKNEINRMMESGESSEFVPLSRIIDVLNDVNLPTSVHEISLRSVWDGMPKYLLHLALPCHTENPELSNEFGCSGNQPGLPFEMNKFQGSNAFVPVHFLLTLHKVFMEEVAPTRRSTEEETSIRSADDELKLQCNRVMEAAHELSSSNSETDSQLQRPVSLADDNDDFLVDDRTVRKFGCHEPVALLDEVPGVDHNPLGQSETGKKKFTAFENFGTGNNRFSNFLFQKRQLDLDISPGMVDQELFNVGCPIELKFKDEGLSFSSKELKLFRTLKKQELDFQKGFRPYQEYLANTSLGKQQ
ncbi:OLC1v1009144C1 [Oldenlandia corymbosa var. corymbosa]|uniref:OLC1v1009144C1 n=1 Tax=Oldenlandia corymbosa var. corymbosa TaxID=529605 RepID=A0AAV1DN68_OLDCO|nr:OLC1v1009144C1 [Oldenlandia corymbosa var. corymbosa]